MAHLLPTEMENAYSEHLVKMPSTRVAAAVTKPKGGKRGWLSQTTQCAFPGLWNLNVGILPKEIQVVSEEEDENNETMAEGVEGGNEGVCMDGEGKPPDDLRYNGEGKKHIGMNRDHAEDSFEAKNRNISKVRSEIRNTIMQ